MRLKKGFTLAEILIVLMVIGAIATMTIPSLMKGVTESQWKTAYKKAYNTVVNLCAMERIAGNLPSVPNSDNVIRMFDSLNSSLAVKDYIDGNIAEGKVASRDDFKGKIKYTTETGDTAGEDATQGVLSYTAGDVSPWIITEDNFGYQVIKGTGSDCGTKSDINTQTAIASVASKACVLVMVDVNGLSNGPNVVEPQSTKGITGAMETLTGDRYYIYIGKDGATAGPKALTPTGRITADLK